jgi:hypothetical protein
MDIEEIGLSTWDSELPNSGYEVFHTPAALRVLDAHTDAEMRLYAGYKGEAVRGLAPVFVSEYPLGSVATSPPPGLAVPRLGPLVMPASPKQRKQESVNRSFVDLLVEELDATARSSLVRMECPRSYGDPRPFEWAGLGVDQSFTYVLDVAGRDLDAIRAGFSSSLRRELRSAKDAEVSVEREGVSGAMAVHDQVAERFDERDISYRLTRSYVRDLVSAMGECARVYVARDETGEYLSGIVVLYGDDVAAFWQGGVRNDDVAVDVNCLLHWRIIADIVDDPPLDSVRGYDLVGANRPRLCRYKAKFGADLVPYYAVESEGLPMSVAKRAYALVGR